MEYAQDIARFFVKELVKNGTTTCAAYATVHPASVTALFSVATEYNMCILAGKVMMNRNAPDYLMDTTHQGELDCRSLIEDWDGKGRNHYVITPRFAITSTPDQLKSAGRLHAEYPSTYIQIFRRIWERLNLSYRSVPVMRIIWRSMSVPDC